MNKNPKKILKITSEDIDIWLAPYIIQNQCHEEIFSGTYALNAVVFSFRKTCLKFN